MPTKLARGVITPSHRYVCLSCRLQNPSLAGGRTTRHQHTAPKKDDSGDTNQESAPKNVGSLKNTKSPSRIGDIIRSFMFNSDAKDKETNSESKVESPGNNEQSPPVLGSIPSKALQPKNSAIVLQQKLQHKFAAQRRQQMLAMQATQMPKAVEVNEEVPKARSVSESTMQGPELLDNRTRRIEQRRNSRMEKLGKKVTGATKAPKAPKATKATEAEKASRPTKRSQQSEREQAKSIGVPLDEVAEITTSTESQTAEEPLTSIEASTKRGQETIEAESKEADDNDSNGKSPGEQTPAAEKIDDIIKILNSSKKPKGTAKSVAKRRKAIPSSTLSKRKAAEVSSLNGLPSSGERQNSDLLSAAATIARFNGQLLAHLKANPEKSPRSLRELKMLHKRLLGKDDSLVRKITDRRSRKIASTPLVRKHVSEAKVSNPSITKYPSDSPQEPDVPSFASLQSALRQSFENVKGVNLENIQIPPSEKVKRARAPPKSPSQKAQNSKTSLKSLIAKATASDLEILPVKVDQPPVPSLAYGLERVLFNPGVYQLQDPRSRVYNFDPYLQKIMPVAEFDFSALKEYITSSRDESLIKIAKEHGKRYMGSTSSMTEALAHFHFLLSQWRPINPSMLSKSFPANLTSFAEFQRVPSAIFLRWKDGSYAIDADKEFATSTVLSMLGKAMEKLLTLNTNDFERYRKSNPGQVTEDEQFAPESYHYSTLGDFLMRSQLDAYDPRLPGTGMFDLKTRSVASIRMDVAHYEQGVGYEIKTRQGEWESYEREYYDMIRNAFLKYSLQVRMGRMDGIFVAFHNIERIFGFQYISLPEMDSTLHGQWDTSIGDQEFRLSLDLLNKVLDRATKKYPETSLRIHIETREVQTPFMYIFAEPVTEEQVAKIQSRNSAKIEEMERKILGLTRGNGSETDDTQEHDSKWEDIQADVQQAMEKDELSVDEPGQDQEAIEANADGTESAPNRPEVFEQGPLYTIKSPASVDDDATAVSAANQEEDGDSENDDDGDSEEDCEDTAKEVDGDRDADEDERIEEIRQEFEELLEDKADIKADDRFEAERKVDGDSIEENDVAPSEGHPVELQNDASLLTKARNEDDASSTALGEDDEATEIRNAEDDATIWPDADPSRALKEEGDPKQRAKADQSFLDSLEVAQADATAQASSSPDILAMTLTLRNKVNGEYVLRPSETTAADEWSIEYSLVEVSEQPRAQALYAACRKRRSKKFDAPLSPDTVSEYIRRLRQMSERGRAWRREQDKSDRERPVQVLSRGVGGVD